MTQFMSKKVITQIRIVLMASSSSFVSGMILSWSLPMIPQLTDRNLPDRLSMNEMGWVVSVTYLGTILGPMVYGFLIDRAGRRHMFLLAVIPCIGSYVICALKPTNYAWLCVGRFIAGFFCVISFVVQPMYIGEVAEDEVRGVLNVMTFTLLQASSLFSAVLGSYLDPTAFSLVSCLIVIAAAILILLIPESPHHLLRHGDNKGAHESLRILRASEDVTEELIKITNYIDKRQHLSSGILEFLMHYRKHVVICVLLALIYMMCGNVFIQSYGAIIFDEAGYKLSGIVCLIILETALTISTATTSFFVHNFGRRQLLSVGVGTTCVFLITAGIYYNLKVNGYDLSRLTWIPLVTLVGSTCMSSTFILSIITTICSEIFPINVKTAGNSFVVLLSGMAIFVGMKIFQVVDTSYGTHVVMYVFAASTFIIGVCLILLLPETKNKSFEQIESDMKVQSISKIVGFNSSDIPHTTL